ncbi:hypothetical protein FXO37_00129 [Capsicum annuum]|nr:hypothetical protein FXO37_00129 [Capsicum annuum]
MQQNIGSQTTNSSARAIVPREVLCLNTFDALTNNIVHVPSESLQLFGEINGMIEVLRKGFSGPLLVWFYRYVQGLDSSHGELGIRASFNVLGYRTRMESALLVQLLLLGSSDITQYGEWEKIRSEDAELANWEDFVEAFLDHIFSQDLMKAKAEEFMNLNQEKMSVKEYALKFT